MKYKYNNQWVDLSIKALDSMVIGSIIQFIGTNLPTGWLECDGSSITQNDYPELYDLIGGTLPDFKGKVLVGQDTSDSDFDTLGETGGEKKHTLTTDEIPSHSHYTNIKTSGSGDRESINGDISVSRNISNMDGAQTSSNGGGQAHNNLQPYAVVKHIIKAKNTTPTMASIVNGYSTSTQDGYSCDFINGTTLYENASGTTGNIALSDSLDNYKTFKIYTMENDNNNRSLGVYEFDTGKTKFMLSGSSVSSAFNAYTKEYTKGTNELTTSTGKLYQSSSGSVLNYEVFKVYKVIGYK